LLSGKTKKIGKLVKFCLDLKLVNIIQIQIFGYKKIKL